MSVEHIEKFYEIIENDDALLQKLADGAESQDQFFDRAVEMAQARGLSFTKQEAFDWAQAQLQQSDDGELSDMQLESVAGGKSSSKTAKTLGTIGGVAAVVGGAALCATGVGVGAGAALATVGVATVAGSQTLID